MTIARQAANQSRKGKPKVREVDVSGKTVYKAEGKQKHFNFRPRDSQNPKGGLYVEQ
jgi:hypothetical protein